MISFSIGIHKHKTQPITTVQTNMSSKQSTHSHPFSYNVPFVGNHSSMVIGSKGKCIQSLQKEFAVNIRAMKADPSKNLPVPYFFIEGNERDVLFASLKVHSLLSLSMSRSEKELKSTNEQLTKDNEEMISLLHEMDTSPALITPN